MPLTAFIQKLIKSFLTASELCLYLERYGFRIVRNAVGNANSARMKNGLLKKSQTPITKHISWRNFTSFRRAPLSTFPSATKNSAAQWPKSATQLRGVGTWTAEMLLIFTFGRHNILSFDDLGIRHGLMRLHSLEAISKKDFEKYRELYSPYGTVASLYLWRIAG